MRKTMIIGLYGALGVLLRYFLMFFFSIFLINILACIMFAFSNKYALKYRDYLQTGFLGGMSSLSAVISYNSLQPRYLILNILCCLIIYKILERVIK